MTQSKNKCHYCHERGGATTDHIVPLMLGGPPSDRRNFVRACLKCNNSKGPSLTNCHCRDCAAAVMLFAPRLQVLAYLRGMIGYLELMEGVHNPGIREVKQC